MESKLLDHSPRIDIGPVVKECSDKEGDGQVGRGMECESNEIDSLIERRKFLIWKLYLNRTKRGQNFILAAKMSENYIQNICI